MPDSITITDKDNSRSVNLSPGTTLVVALDENPTTGFNWHLQPYAENILKLESDDYSLGKGAVGGGGIRRFQFRATTKGHAAIRLRYRRSWESPEEFAKEFAVDVLVQ